MSQVDFHDEEWQKYQKEELKKISPILHRLGFSLDEFQPHASGERSVISGKKLVLLGRRLSDSVRVVIKGSSSPEGKTEMRDEQRRREALDAIPFAYRTFFSPKQLVRHEERGLLISIHLFLEQSCPFLEHTLDEQFFLSLAAFETQESAHAATYEHNRVIASAFPIYDAKRYLREMKNNNKDIKTIFPKLTELHKTIETAADLFENNLERIEQYTGFLTHTDFVPHNFRVLDKKVYLLDHSSLRFGNRHDGWARFLNFMILHNRPLETALVTYFKGNRSEEENESLALMRLQRLCEIIRYYARRTQKSTGDLQQLDHARVLFWRDVLNSQIQAQSIPQERIDAYIHLRDQLRTEEEKRRQKGLH